MATCPFGMMNRYTSVETCMARYAAYTATQRGCVSYHVCVASTATGGVGTHCPHIGAVVMGANNLCQTPMTPAP
jgi:hypothetical protein